MRHIWHLRPFAKLDVHVASVIHCLGEARCQLDGIFHDLLYPDHRKPGVGYRTTNARLLKVSGKRLAECSTEGRQSKALASGVRAAKVSTMERSCNVVHGGTRRPRTPSNGRHYRVVSDYPLERSKENRRRTKHFCSGPPRLPKVLDEHDVATLFRDLCVQNPVPIGRHRQSVVAFFVQVQDFSYLPGGKIEVLD